MQVFHMTCVLCTSSKNNRYLADICVYLSYTVLQVIRSADLDIGYKILASHFFNNVKMTDAVSGLLALTNVARKKSGITIQMVLFYSNLSFHRNTAHLNVFDFDNFGAEDSSGSFGELVASFTFTL